MFAPPSLLIWSTQTSRLMSSFWCQALSTVLGLAVQLSRGAAPARWAGSKRKFVKKRPLPLLQQCPAVTTVWWFPAPQEPLLVIDDAEQTKLLPRSEKNSLPT